MDESRSLTLSKEELNSENSQRTDSNLNSSLAPEMDSKRSSMKIYPVLIDIWVLSTKNVFNLANKLILMSCLIIFMSVLSCLMSVSNIF